MNIKTFFYLAGILLALCFSQVRASELTEKDYCQGLENFKFVEYSALRCFAEVLLTEDYSKIDQYKNIETSEDFKLLYKFYFFKNSYNKGNWDYLDFTCKLKEIGPVNYSLCGLIGAMELHEVAYNFACSKVPERDFDARYHLKDPLPHLGFGLQNLNFIENMYIENLSKFNDQEGLKLYLDNIYNLDYDFISLFFERDKSFQLNSNIDHSPNPKNIYSCILYHINGFKLETENYRNNRDDLNSVSLRLFDNYFIQELTSRYFFNSRRIQKDSDHINSFREYRHAINCSELTNTTENQKCKSEIPQPVMQKSRTMTCDWQFLKALPFYPIETIRQSKGYGQCINKLIQKR